MPVLNVNPTRMELTRLKTRLRTASRGHKLLKDKRDELMKQFMDVVRENRALRRKVEEGLERAATVSLEMEFKNIMSVDVPVYQFHTNQGGSGAAPYGFAATSGELDDAVEALREVFQDMLHLAEVEKTSQLLAQEIEKTRRRVNALEYVKIPQMQETIKYITMKLDENERASTIRLMKVKDLILKEAIEERQSQDRRSVQTFAPTAEV